MRIRVLILLVPCLVLAMILGHGILSAQGGSAYGGVENCKMCHPDIYTEWSKSDHARGFELLTNVGQEKNAECLPCHTTGYGKGGYVDEATTPGLKGTACESCHGPGAGHMGDKTKITRKPPAGTCEGCHQATNIHSVTK